MAYITNYTYSKLCAQIQINSDINLETFTKFIYDDTRIFYLLNKMEVRYLFTFRNLLADCDEFIATHYKHVPQRIDNHEFVFESIGKLKYHLSLNCPSIKNDFINFHIPVEIKELGGDAVSDYRKWFVSGRYAEAYYEGKLDQEKMIFAYNMRFPNKYSVAPLNENFKLIEKRDNSNISMLDRSFDMTEFEKKLEKHIENYYAIFSCKVLKTLSKFKHLSIRSDEEIEIALSEVFSPEFVKNYGINAVRNKFRIAKEIVNSILQLLIEYFKWTYNLNSREFSSIALENFGLECCEFCKKGYQKLEFA